MNLVVSKLGKLSQAAAAATLFAASPGVAQTNDHAPVALQSAKKLTQEKADSETWTYMKPGLKLTGYQSLIVDPTLIYTGPDAQFDGIDATDRAKYAEIITLALRQEIAKILPVIARSGETTLRLRVTLLGAKKTKGGIATATRLTTFGFAANALKSVAGKPGTMTGSILYAVELLDSKSGELLVAGVRRRSPDALDIPATLSTTDTVKAIAHDFAGAIRDRLEKATDKSSQ